MKTNIRNITLGALLAIGLGAPYLQAADVAISALPTGSALAGTEPIPMVQGAATKKTTPADLSTYLLSGSATTEVLANNAGAFDGDSGFTFNATNNSVDLGGATVTASDPVLDLSQTWNNGAVTFTGLKFNATNTASASASLLLDLQVGGTSVASARRDGLVTAAGGVLVSTLEGIGIVRNGSLGGLNLGAFDAGGSTSAHLNNTALTLRGALGLSNGNVNLGPDVLLYRGAAGVFAQRNGANAQTFQVFDTYTDASNYGRLALNTSLTGDWVQVAAETAGTAGDNYGIALTPTGTGAISAHVPDSTTAGGNARGANAVDFVNVARSAASQVASGQYSTISGGGNNTASGANSSVGGGVNNAATSTSSRVGGGSGNTASLTNAIVGGGYSNTASGDSSIVGGGYSNTASGAAASVLGGQENTASGAMSEASGYQSTTRGLWGARARSSGRRSASGDAQMIEQTVRRTTADDTPVSLATDGTPAATTVMVLPSDSTATCTSIVTANSTAAGVVSMAGFKADAIVKNDSSTMTISGGTCTAIGTADAALTTATCALVANGTLDSIEMQVTGVAATTVYWVAEVKCVQAL